MKGLAKSHWRYNLIEPSGDEPYLPVIQGSCYPLNRLIRCIVEREGASCSTETVYEVQRLIDNDHGTDTFRSEGHVRK